MNLRVILAVAVCKAVHGAIRLLHRGGTAMPGSIAMKICPDMLKTLAAGVETVVITGTNGKTTSSRMVEEAFRAAGRDCLANRSGANLLSGITTEFALNSTLSGKCRKRYAVIECDEAAARRTLGYLQPKVVLVTNLFRDQLDRYGEVTHTLENIREGLKKAPDAALCLNADDSLVSSLALELPNRAVFFGIEASAAGEAAARAPSDATHCIRCRAPYEYDYVTYAHLGGFRCPECGYRRHAADVAVTEIESMDGSGSRITLRVGGQDMPVAVGLGAIYNIYNAAGAVCAAQEMGIAPETAASALATFRCGFGRMETFPLGKKGARMLLVKNPAGCSLVTDFLAGLGEEMDLALLLNDNGADGTDVSWIWDADFERLASLGDRLCSVFVSGIRAEDMRVRLKYAGIEDGKITVERDCDALCERLSRSERPVFIVPTYTAMLDMRAALVRRCGGTDFWEG